jgi:hypothetical protein
MMSYWRRFVITRPYAVISRVVGLPSGYATIRDGNPRSWCLDDGDLRSILTCLAGRAASLELLGYASDSGCEADDRKAAALLKANGFTLDKRRSLLADARELIRQHRAAVERVANALLAKEMLTAGEIDQLMMDAGAWRRVTRSLRPRAPELIEVPQDRAPWRS